MPVCQAVLGFHELTLESVVMRWKKNERMKDSPQLEKNPVETGYDSNLGVADVVLCVLIVLIVELRQHLNLCADFGSSQVYRLKYSLFSLCAAFLSSSSSSPSSPSGGNRLNEGNPTTSLFQKAVSRIQ